MVGKAGSYVGLPSLDLPPADLWETCGPTALRDGMAWIEFLDSCLVLAVGLAMAVDA